MLSKKIIIPFFSVVLCFSSLNFLNISENHNTAYAQEEVLLNSSNKVIESYFEKVKREEQLKTSTNDIKLANMPQWITKAEKFAKDALIAGLDFLVLDDIRTIFDPNASTVSKSLAVIALFPAGKVVKGAKAFKLLEDYGKGSLAKAAIDFGNTKVLLSSSKGILLQGNKQRGWTHIYNQHIDRKMYKNKSKFPGNLNNTQIKNNIMKTLNKGKVVLKQTSGNQTYSLKFGKKNMRYIHVVVDSNGYIRTAYPSNTYRP